MKYKNTSKALEDLFNELDLEAYNGVYHSYQYKEANQVIRKHFEKMESDRSDSEVKLKNVVIPQLRNLLTPIINYFEISKGTFDELTKQHYMSQEKIIIKEYIPKIKKLLGV